MRLIKIKGDEIMKRKSWIIGLLAMVGWVGVLTPVQAMNLPPIERPSIIDVPPVQKPGATSGWGMRIADSTGMQPMTINPPSSSVVTGQPNLAGICSSQGGTWSGGKCEMPSASSAAGGIGVKPRVSWEPLCQYYADFTAWSDGRTIYLEENGTRYRGKTRTLTAPAVIGAMIESYEMGGVVFYFDPYKITYECFVAYYPDSGGFYHVRHGPFYIIW